MLGLGAGVRAEIIDGVLETAPSPLPRHSRAQRVLGRAVLSPSNVATDRVAKRRLYAAHGVPYYWIVDPAMHTVEAMHLRDGVWVELGSWGDGDVARIDPFAAIELDIDRLFPPRAG